MAEITTIGNARDVDEVLEEIERLRGACEVQEMLVIVRYQVNGKSNWHYERTPLRCKFRLVGVMQWVANTIIAGNDY